MGCLLCWQIAVSPSVHTVVDVYDLGIRYLGRCAVLRVQCMQCLMLVKYRGHNSRDILFNY